MRRISSQAEAEVGGQGHDGNVLEEGAGYEEA